LKKKGLTKSLLLLLRCHRSSLLDFFTWTDYSALALFLGRSNTHNDPRRSTVTQLMLIFLTYFWWLRGKGD
jgi:hypothetical protein